MHNKIEDIGRIAGDVRELAPNAQVGLAHGQMRERDLEQTMLDFYHRRFQVLVCTTIIETGIDIPNANTIVINRADRFGTGPVASVARTGWVDRTTAPTPISSCRTDGR